MGGAGKKGAKKRPSAVGREVASKNENETGNRPAFAPPLLFGTRKERAYPPVAPHDRDFPPTSHLVLTIIYHAESALSMGFLKFFCENLIFFSKIFGHFHRFYFVLLMFPTKKGGAARCRPYHILWSEIRFPHFVRNLCDFCRLRGLCARLTSSPSFHSRRTSRPRPFFFMPASCRLLPERTLSR